MKRVSIVLFVILMLLVFASLVHAQSRDPDYDNFNSAFVSDLIVSDRACTEHKVEVACKHAADLVSTITPKMDHDFKRFIWSEYPFKAKNGGTNIMLRYQRAVARQRQ